MNVNAVPLIVRRTFQCPPERLFDAFSSGSALVQWFTPDPEISVQVLQLDFIVGGRFRLQYAMEDGRCPIVGGVYKVISRPSRIMMTWKWEAPDVLADIPMQVTFDFVKSENATELVITHEGIPSNQICTIHEDGWTGTIDQLDRYLQSVVHSGHEE